MRRALVTLLIIAALAAGGVWVYLNYLAPGDEAQVEREEFTIRRGTLEALVNATGIILPEKQTTLAFRTPGRVAGVSVEQDQSVLAGEVLARLETTDLEYAVAQAELALATAQAQLLRLQQPPSDLDIAAAQAALDSAQAFYDRLVAGPTEDEIEVARTNLDQAKATVDQAQLAYDQVADRPDVAMLPQALQLQQATILYRAAQASFNLTMREASAAEIAAARANVAQAEAALTKLQEGVPAEEIRLAQLQVEQAELALEQAHHQLEGTSLVAPHDGTITLVGIQEGELTGGQPAFVLTDLSQYHIDISVDEVDIGRLTEGQSVTITLDALPGEILVGQVDEIAQTAQIDTGVVTYRVTVRLAPTTAALRMGMTANVDVLTEQRENVLLVPNRFIRIDRTSGKAYVDRASGPGGLVQSVEIQIGLRDDQSSEVLAGLREGEVVVLAQGSSREQLQQMMQMGSP